VHAKILGRNSMSWGESRPRITPIERGLAGGDTDL
jgi:hypothetical protein